MSWKTFHSRGETLRAVMDTVNDRRDGILPTEVPGVAEHFTDELDLIGALMLKWHARLSGNIERALVREPMDLESAIAAAWHATAEDMPGVRLVIDRCAEHPTGPEMEQAMVRAREAEWARLAVASGLANSKDAAAVAVGRHVEERARVGLAPASATPDRTDAPTPGEPSTVSFADRIKAALAA
ncbi:MAG: hypothetical protein ABWX73_00560 [Marmoricola sp.]